MRNEKGQFVKGHPFTNEMLAKISQKLKGRQSWNKGIPMPEKSRKKLSDSLKGGLFGTKDYILILIRIYALEKK